MRRSARVAGVLLAVGLVWWGIRASGNDPVPPAEASPAASPAVTPVFVPPASGRLPEPASTVASERSTPAKPAVVSEASEIVPAMLVLGGGESGARASVHEAFSRIVLNLQPPPCPADFNKDGSVDGADFAAFTESYHELGDADGMVTDLNGDGFVDFGDLEEMQVAMEQGCPTAVGGTLTLENATYRKLTNAGATLEFKMDLGEIMTRAEEAAQRPANQSGQVVYERLRLLSAAGAIK